MRPPRHAALIGVALLASLLALPAAGSAAQSLSEVRAERSALQERLDEASTQLSEIEERVATLGAEEEELVARTDELAGEVATLQEGMQAQIVALFKRGAVRDPLTVFLSSDDPNEALLRAETLERVIVSDLAEVETLGADRRRLEVLEDRLAVQRREVAAAVEEHERLQASLRADLERAAELEERLEAEERERQRREQRAREAAAAERRAREARESRSTGAAASGSEAGAGGRSAGGSSGGSGGGSTAVSPSGKACPVGQPRSFSDTWGAPRSGGRSHRGTDILAPYGTPVYAIVSGTWAIQSPGPSAGLWAILRGDDGNHYWYLHLQSHTVGSGRVTVGQQVATNGDTGNARGTPHVHFELHPGGGGAINPYPTLRGTC